MEGVVSFIRSKCRLEVYASALGRHEGHGDTICVNLEILECILGSSLIRSEAEKRLLKTKTYSTNLLYACLSCEAYSVSHLNIEGTCEADFISLWEFVETQCITLPTGPREILSKARGGRNATDYCFSTGINMPLAPFPDDGEYLDFIGYGKESDTVVSRVDMESSLHMSLTLLKRGTDRVRCHREVFVHGRELRTFKH